MSPSDTAEAPLWPVAARADGGRDVLGIGECALDHVGILADGLPEFGGKRPLVEYRRMPGGQMATTLSGLAKLGLRVGFVGSVGEGADGREVLAPLAAAGIDVSQVRAMPGATTQMAMILVDRGSGERTIAWYRDPALALGAEDVAPGSVEAARALHVDTGHVVAATAAAQRARAAGIPVVLDADAHVPGLDALLPWVDFPIVSQSFAETSSGDVSVSAALDALVRDGARMAVMTLGEVGAVAKLGDRWIRSPGFAVAARDTTGAGDAFRAGFLLGILEGGSAERTLELAHAVAAHNCTGLGAQGGLPDRAALDAFLAGHERRPWREPESLRI